MESLIVPSSIQRIRSYLVEICGMKVKPWAGAEETLGALHATLVARQGCDMFWTSLRVLLETLARDLKARQDAAPGTLVDNEVLDREQYATLIDEIRAALARQTAAPPASTYRRLASALSAPALGLLLFLGGVATIGCAREPLKSQTKTPDAAVNLADARASQPETKADGSIAFILPDTRPGPDTSPAPDAAPATYATTTGPDGGTVTIRDIMESCNLPIEQQGMILGCLSTMEASWSTEMATALAGQDCLAVASSLGCTPNEVCATTYGPSYGRICMPVLIYIGVRFV